MSYHSLRMKGSALKENKQARDDHILVYLNELNLITLQTLYLRLLLADLALLAKLLILSYRHFHRKIAKLKLGEKNAGGDFGVLYPSFEVCPPIVQQCRPGGGGKK